MPLSSIYNSKKILVVARWPVGGIRTYMRYMFRYFPQHYKIVVLATSTHEDEALKCDAAWYGADLVFARRTGVLGLSREVISELSKNKYDVILSQGFISAVAVYFANLFTSVPHVLTIHGVLEKKYFTGPFVWVISFLLEIILTKITVHYAVSYDMLFHLYEQFPRLKERNNKAVVIPNGIDLNDFDVLQQQPSSVRDFLGIPASSFLFGFFGRFMEQKGFDLLIDAVHVLKDLNPDRDFVVVSVGSGDYLREYKDRINTIGLKDYFHFLPFQPKVHQLYLQMDVIVMPSRWEASGLLAMEALCLGIPLIVSDCIGLRETTVDTPAIVFVSEDIDALAKCMYNCLKVFTRSDFQQFVPTARERYDVSNSAGKLIALIESI